MLSLSLEIVLGAFDLGHRLENARGILFSATSTAIFTSALVT